MLISSYSVFAHGTLSKNLVYCNSQPVPPVFLSTVSRICKEATDLVASRSKNQARRVNCPSRILVSTVLTCRRTRHTKRSTPSFYGLLRRQSDSGRSRRKVWRKGNIQLYHLRIIRGRYQCGFGGDMVDQSSEKEIGRNFFLCSHLLSLSPFFGSCGLFLFLDDAAQRRRRRRLRNVHYCPIRSFPFESFRFVLSCSDF